MGLLTSDGAVARFVNQRRSREEETWRGITPRAGRRKTGPLWFPRNFHFIEVRATFSVQGVAIHTNDRHFVRQRSEEQDEKEPETCHATREQTVESKTKCVADVGDSGRWEIVPVGARLLSVSEGGKLGKMEQGRVYLLTKNASK